MEKTVGDIISLVVENQEESTYLVVVDNDGVCSLPTLRTGRESWIRAANSLLNQMMGLQMKNGKQLEMYRMWTGDDADCFYHCVFLTSLTKDQLQKQKRHSESGGVKNCWKSLAEINKTEFSSPEVTTYFSNSTQELEKKMKIFDQIGIVLGSFVEVLKEHVFVGPAVKEVLEQLVPDSWNPTEQLMLIREFQLACNPNVLMGPNVFRKFVSRASISDDHASNLFRAADLTGRGALSCKEFLCIVAFLEPGERTSAACLEAEARISFRYFNKRKNGVWSSGELEAFFNEVRKKFKATPVLDKDIAKFYRDCEIGQGTDVTILQFVKAISASKFRIPQGFLKNNNKMTQTFLSSPSSSPPKPKAAAAAAAPAETQPSRKLTQLSTGSADVKSSAKKVADRKSAANGAAANTSQPKYLFAYHVVKMLNGAVTETVPMDEFKMCMSNMEMNQTFTGKDQSVVNLSNEMPYNEIIMGLKYFANSTTPNGKSKSPFTWDKVEFNHLGELLIKISNLVIEIFKREPRMLRVSTPVIVMGDLHGNYVDLWLFENAMWPAGLELLTGSVLILGDFVDRGPHGVEVIAYLFSQKIKCPKRLNLVRGNHEIRHVQKQFTFFTECQKKFGKDLGQDVWKAVNNAFDYLPVAALVDDAIFGCHGGVPPPWLCPNISVIDSIPIPLANPDSQSPLAWELLWNDPIRDAWMNDAVRTELSLNDGFAVNKRRGTAHMFSPQALDKFLKINKLSFAVRAHEVVDCGFKLMQNGKLATIFSTSYYSGMTNKAACMLIQDGKIRVISLVTDDYHKNEQRKETPAKT